MQYSYIGNGMAASADLKATLHRVRTVVDNLPKEMKDAVTGRTYSPRKRRLVTIPNPEDGGAPITVAPYLAPRTRHNLMLGVVTR